MKYNYIYKTILPFSGKEAYVGKINKNYKQYTTGYFTQKKHRNIDGRYILDNDPLRECVLALDKLIIKHQLEIPLQILKPKQK